MGQGDKQVGGEHVSMQSGGNGDRHRPGYRPLHAAPRPERHSTQSVRCEGQTVPRCIPANFLKHSCCALYPAFVTSNDLYLQGILNKYPARTAAQYQAAMVKTEVDKYFRDLDSSFYSGSFAKGTAVHTSGRGSDVDIFLSVRSSSTLADIYEATYNFAAARGWQPTRQNVSVGIKYSGYDIDLVPGRIISGYQNYHNLYVRKAQTWRQTNVSQHVRLVSQSGRLSEIRLLKIWRNLHGLDFTSFLLELFVLQELKGRPLNNLAENFWYLLGCVETNIAGTVIIDPANSNNRISDSMTQAEKNRVREQARVSRSKQQWNQVVW